MLTGLDGIGQGIAEIFRFWTQTQNADNRIKNKNLKDEIKEDKAIDAAESMFLANVSYRNGKINKKQWEYLHSKYYKIFLKNN